MLGQGHVKFSLHPSYLHKSVVPATYTVQWHALNYATNKLALQMLFMGCLHSALSDGNTEGNVADKDWPDTKTAAAHTKICTICLQFLTLKQ